MELVCIILGCSMDIPHVVIAPMLYAALHTGKCKHTYTQIHRHTQIHTYWLKQSVLEKGLWTILSSSLTAACMEHKVYKYKYTQLKQTCTHTFVHMYIHITNSHPTCYTSLTNHVVCEMLEKCFMHKHTQHRYSIIQLHRPKNNLP